MTKTNFSDLNVTLIQSDLHWENAAANRQMFGEKIAAINEETDIIVLPEMFTTGFSMAAEKLAESPDGETVKWMKKQAAQMGAVVTGSIIVKEGGQYFNRLFWAAPNGNISHYDKRHLFSLGGEEKVYSSGNDKVVFEWKGWRICPLICYDLRCLLYTSPSPRDA